MRCGCHDNTTNHKDNCILLVVNIEFSSLVQRVNGECVNIIKSEEWGRGSIIGEWEKEKLKQRKKIKIKTEKGNGNGNGE